LLAFVKACKEIIADGKIRPQEAEALRRWLSAAGWLKTFLAGERDCGSN
jgi:hypothetical protein